MYGFADGLASGLAGGLGSGHGGFRLPPSSQKSNAESAFSRPQTMFKTLRRLHGHNLESQGLNNISDAFQAFVTRARFFSVGRLRRTWSHSAVEFMKYRKLLPMLVADENEIGAAFDDFDAGLTMETSRVSMCAKGDSRKIVVTNVSPRATVSQLQSFFNKFGKVASCHMPSDDRRQSMYATLPKNPRCQGTIYIIFKKDDAVTRALNAPKDELKFYDNYMNVSLHVSKRKGGSSSRTSSQSGAESLGLGFAIPAGPPAHEGTISRGSSNLSLSSSTATLSISDSLGGFSFDDLPSRALQKVLSRTSAIDRIRFERVNKAWLEAAIKSWSECPILSFRNDRQLLSLFTKENPLRNSHLKLILTRCGIHLKELDLSKVTNLLDDKAFEIIAANCPNLQKLNITGVTGTLNALRSLGESLPKLKTIIYKDMATLGEKSFWYLFRSSGSSIKVVDLSGCRRLLGRCFKLFSKNLETVRLDGCSRIDDETIEDICLRSSNVRELRLNWCLKVTDESISLITRNLMDLEILSLCGDNFKGISSVCLTNFARLTKLTHLYFDHNSAIDDSAITAFSSHLTELKCLSLSNSGSDSQITSAGLMSIASLSNLEELDLSSIAGVNSAVVSAITHGCAKLATLRLRSCIYLDDEGVQTVASLPHIEHIDFSGCILVSTSAIQTLISTFTLSEENSNAITLVIGGTVCQIGHLRLRNSRVVIDEADYSGSSLQSARAFINTMQKDINEDYSDDELSDGEFDSLNAQRSFIVDALNAEDDSPIESDKAMLEWAHREAVNLGLIPDDET
ncbi:hypothetical protein QR680_000051 [Steinernema hermaphroditum]|uniref:RRM domain-containing protein n=1 Tax=Steinernema hermaphroditum TaxID=289476 RepID=A0AA39LCV2_9BILA|nr:hypothetical protein QR680_000051 [Steinernema hermaphroditum]